MDTSPVLNPLPAPNPEHDSRQRREKQTACLVERLRGAQGVTRDTLLQALVETNMPVAKMLARRYVGRGIVADDLEQVAHLGLVKAAHGYDPMRGSDFLAYAMPTIRGELRRHFRDAGWMVRPPRRIQELQARLWVAEAELTQSLQRSPTASQLAKHVEVELDEVAEALAVEGCFAPSSLDAPRGDGEGDGDGGTLADRQGKDDPSFESCEARLMLAPAVRELGERDRRIIELRFSRGWSQQQIGDEIGVTQMQVSRLLARILRDLRRSLGALT